MRLIRTTLYHQWKPESCIINFYYRVVVFNHWYPSFSWSFVTSEVSIIVLYSKQWTAKINVKIVTLSYVSLEKTQ